MYAKKLKQYWSPEQISGRLKVDYPEDQQMRISPVTIYSWIEAEFTGPAVYLWAIFSTIAIQHLTKTIIPLIFLYKSNAF